MDIRTTLVAILIIAVIQQVGCAVTNNRSDLPYPAFVQTDELPDMFVAALPGVRAKQYVSDMHTRTSSNRIDIPPDWSGTTGGAPGKSLEIFVLAGELKFSEFVLRSGGYAYVPPGNLGFRLKSDGGARILYFLDDVDASSVIRSPLILESTLLTWQETSPGVFVKELRADPGNGSKTWLKRIDPGANLPWQSSSANREGYLVRGEYQHSECFDGEAETGQYLPGGYFQRPANVVNAGPAASATAESVWFLREQGPGVTAIVDRCIVAETGP